MFTNVKGFLLNVHLNLFKLYFEIIVGLHSVLRHEREILYALCLVFFNGTSCKSVTQYHNQKIGIGVIRSTQFPPLVLPVCSVVCSFITCKFVYPPPQLGHGTTPGGEEPSLAVCNLRVPPRSTLPPSLTSCRLLIGFPSL